VCFCFTVHNLNDSLPEPARSAINAFCGFYSSISQSFDPDFKWGGPGVPQAIQCYEPKHVNLTFNSGLHGKCERAANFD